MASSAETHIVANEMMSSKPSFKLDEFLPYQLAVLANRTSRAFAKIYTDQFGISIPEWRVLAHLSQVNGVSVREIQSRVDMDKSKVTRAVQRLEASNLVHKIQSETDRRLVVLTLTPAGRDVIKKLAPQAGTYETEVLRGLTESEKLIFRKAIQTLMDTAGEDAQTAEKGKD